jgi:AbrB family looped-hinge helix DNA binding protein
METVATVKGQVVIPAPLRQKFGIKKGTKFHVYEENGKIVLEPINFEQLLDSLQGILKGTGAFEEFVAERARDREKEDAEFPLRVR